MADSRKQIVCAVIIHLAATIGFFSLGLYIGNNGNKALPKKCPTTTTATMKPEHIIHSPYNLLSNKMMSELLIKVPINGNQLSEILIYEKNRVIGQIPGRNVCALRRRLLNCILSTNCYDSEVPFLTKRETEELSRLLDGMIMCNDN